MKIKSMIILLTLLISPSAFAQTFTDTILTTPLVVVPAATVLRQYSFHWLPDSFVVQYNLLAADGSVVEQRTCTLTGADFTTGDAAIVVANKVGMTYKRVIAAYLQAKCKTKWALTGTE